MKTRYLLGITLAVAILVLGYAIFTRMKGPQQVPASEINTTPASPSGSAATSSAASSTSTPSYTLAQVATHNGASSCWSAINGKVYDLTNWINQHPGGPEHILSICGTDGSAAFNAQHAGQPQPAAELAQFYIGELAQ